MNKTDIILAGVGGQGILSIAAAIGLAAIDNKLYLKQAEVHGMSQRGGAVQSNLRISDQQIWSDLIPYGTADMILSVEPMEALRYIPYLSDKGWIITSSTPFVNIDDYPQMEQIINQFNEFPKSILLDADAIARNIGSIRASNMVMLGAASPFIQIPEKNLKGAIIKLFEKKGEKIIDININAFEEGKKIAATKLNTL